MFGTDTHWRDCTVLGTDGQCIDCRVGGTHRHLIEVKYETLKHTGQAFQGEVQSDR